MYIWAVIDMKIFWKIYFLLFTFIVASGYMTVPIGNTTAYFYFDILFSILGLVGLWCYVYGKSFLCPGLWRLFFCFFIFWDAINIIYGPFYSGKEFIGQKEQLYTKLVSAAITAPTYFALFLYSFRSKGIWQRS